MLRHLTLLAATLAIAACSADGAEDVDESAGEVRTTSRKLQQATALGEMVAFMRDRSAWHGAVDYAALDRSGRAAILQGDGSDASFRSVLFDTFVRIPQGHQLLHFEGCGTTLPRNGFTRRGVCGRPHARGIVVTNARSNNPLGLARGDLVLGLAGGQTNDALFDTLARRPMCVTSRPSRSYRDSQIATTFADLVRPGESIEVESPNGARRTVVVPELAEASADLLSCQDPFGRDTSIAVSWELRPDGIGVIRLPAFVDGEQTLPQTGDPADLAAYDERFLDKIARAFERVKDARAIIWDVRGNSGGRTRVALAIASGFPGATSTPLSSCQFRAPGAPVPQSLPSNVAAYQLEPGGPFAFDGKVAILADGLDYSATDYFVLASRLRTNAVVVGQATAGGFGASTDTRTLSGPPAFAVTVDSYLCSSIDDGLPLEGRSVLPTLAVDYQPGELAAGIDSVLERAAASLAR
jgi:hypothetical protein